jgi:hypothetical protein
LEMTAQLELDAGRCGCGCGDRRPCHQKDGKHGGRESAPRKHAT